jgi:hypothetical protein
MILVMLKIFKWIESENSYIRGGKTREDDYVLSCEYLVRNAMHDLDSNKAWNVHSNGIKSVSYYIYIQLANCEIIWLSSSKLSIICY